MHYQRASALTLLCIPLLATAWPALATGSEEGALDTIRANDIAARVEVLASDEFQGRMPGTIEEEKTLAYLTAQLRKYGVLPMPGGNYLQDVPLVRKTPRASTHLVVKSKSGEIALVIGENATAKTGGAVERVTIDASEIVFVGFGIVAETQEWDDYAGVDVKGKTVMALIQDPRGDADSLYFKGRALSQPDPNPEYGAFFRSDHYPFVKKGVPAIFAVGGPLDDPPAPAEMTKRFDDYMKAGYHHPSDEYRDDWDLRGIVGDVKIYFLTGYALANETRFPNWYADSEFRSIRDRQRAAP